MKSKNEGEIWAQLHKITQARPIPISDDDSRQMTQLAQRRKQAEDARARSLARNELDKKGKAKKGFAKGGGAATLPVTAQTGTQQVAAAA